MKNLTKMNMKQFTLRTFSGFSRFATLRLHFNFISAFSTTECRKDDNKKLNSSLIPPVYPNAKKYKKEIVKDNLQKVGIYQWTNLESGKSYIGSSLNLGRRLKLYYSDYHLNDSDNRNMIINKALIKHGHSKFSLEILEYCDPEDVIERENYYIKVFKPEYNILQEAGSSFGYKHTKETLLKMSEAKKAENHPLFGKFHSEETKILMNEAKKGHTLSEETRMKISKTLKGKITSSETKAKMSSAIGTETEILDKETNEVTTYSSGHQAAKALGCSDWVIRTYANSKKLYKDRYIITKKFK